MKINEYSRRGKSTVINGWPQSYLKYEHIRRAACLFLYLKYVSPPTATFCGSPLREAIELAGKFLSSPCDPLQPACDSPAIFTTSLQPNFLKILCHVLHSHSV
jgi:hypothetical protein